MGTLRSIGESISQTVTKDNAKSFAVFKKNGKYYEKLDGKEITADEVGDRTIIAFGK